MNEIEAKITTGFYKGDPISVKFGRPLKIFCRGKDVSDTMVELFIEISTRGQLLHLKFAETSPSQLRGEKP